MNVFCAKSLVSGITDTHQLDVIAEWGYVASDEREAKHIASVHGWQYVGKLDDMDLTDQNRAMIERDCFGLTVH